MDNQELLKKVSLTDTLSTPTQNKPEAKADFLDVEIEEIEGKAPNSEGSESPDGKGDFLPPIKVENVEDIEEIEDDEDDEFDPVASAESAIDIMDVLQQSIFMPIVSLKLVKRYGGKEKIKDMKAALAKSLMDEKLSEEDKKLVAQLKAYTAQLKEVRAEVPFDDSDVAALKPSTIRWCEKNGIKVNENLGFAAGAIKVFSKRIIDVLTI